MTEFNRTPPARSLATALGGMKRSVLLLLSAIVLTAAFAVMAAQAQAGPMPEGSTAGSTGQTFCDAGTPVTPRDQTISTSGGAPRFPA